MNGSIVDGCPSINYISMRRLASMSDNEIPECCGSGCAVCVLDNIEPVSSVRTHDGQKDPEVQCCGTGCTVCVLDYIGGSSSSSLEAGEDRLKMEKLKGMLEAIDVAEQILAKHRRKSFS
jgi:hypothetical protein